MSDFIRVAGLAEVPPGQSTVVEADGKEIALFNVGGALYAIDNTCPHRGGPLAEGEIDGCLVSCPWHGWPFDITTGKCQLNQEIAVTRFDVQVQGEDILVKVG